MSVWSYLSYEQRVKNDANSSTLSLSELCDRRTSGQLDSRSLLWHQDVGTTWIQADDPTLQAVLSEQLRAAEEQPEIDTLRNQLVEAERRWQAHLDSVEAKHHEVVDAQKDVIDKLQTQVMQAVTRAEESRKQLEEEREAKVRVRTETAQRREEEKKDMEEERQAMESAMEQQRQQAAAERVGASETAAQKEAEIAQLRQQTVELQAARAAVIAKKDAELTQLMQKVVDTAQQLDVERGKVMAAEANSLKAEKAAQAIKRAEEAADVAQRSAQDKVKTAEDKARRAEEALKAARDELKQVENRAKSSQEAVDRAADRKVKEATDKLKTANDNITQLCQKVQMLESLTASQKQLLQQYQWSEHKHQPPTTPPKALIAPPQPLRKEKAKSPKQTIEQNMFDFGPPGVKVKEVAPDGSEKSVRVFLTQDQRGSFILNWCPTSTSVAQQLALNNKCAVLVGIASTNSAYVGVDRALTIKQGGQLLAPKKELFILCDSAVEATKWRETLEHIIHAKKL